MRKLDPTIHTPPSALDSAIARFISHEERHGSSYDADSFERGAKWAIIQYEKIRMDSIERKIAAREYLDALAHKHEEMRACL